MAYPYDRSIRALLQPAKGVTLFPQGRPATDEALCAEMSRLVYAGFENESGERARVEETLQRVGFCAVDLFSAEGTQGLLATDTQSPLTILVFRGTEVNPADWRTDLWAMRTAWPGGGQVHRGFQQALDAVWKQLAPELARAPGRHLYTGHSLGAALATLAAARRPPDALYTYGSPRVGDDAFVRAMPRFAIHRFSNCCDLVCRVPLQRFGYRHLGAVRYLDRLGQVQESPADRVMSLDRWRARITYTVRWAWRPGNLPSRDLADHSPVNYFSALSQTR